MCKFKTDHKRDLKILFNLKRGADSPIKQIFVLVKHFKVQISKKDKPGVNQEMVDQVVDIEEHQKTDFKNCMQISDKNCQNFVIVWKIAT